jgi:hypothetical protein
MELTNKEDIISFSEKIKEKTSIIIHYNSDSKINKRHRITGQVFEEVFKDINILDVKKLTISDGFIGFNYEKEKLDRGILSEYGQDTIPKESWHENFSENGVIKRHKLTGQLYLWFLNDDKPSFNRYYIEDKEDLDSVKLSDFINKKKSNSKINVKTIKLDNIIKIIIK